MDKDDERTRNIPPFLIINRDPHRLHLSARHILTKKQILMKLHTETAESTQGGNPHNLTNLEQLMAGRRHLVESFIKLMSCGDEDSLYWLGTQTDLIEHRISHLHARSMRGTAEGHPAEATSCDEHAPCCTRRHHQPLNGGAEALNRKASGRRQWWNDTRGRSAWRG